MPRLRDLFLRNTSQRQTIFKNFSWLFIGQVVSRLIRAMVVVYAARALGTSEYGVFTYVLGLAGFFAIFADIGINPILTKEVAKDPEQGRYFFATSFWIKIVLLLGTSALVIFAAPHFSKIEEARALLPFAALLITFDGIREFTIAFFRAKEKMELEALVMSVTNIAITVFGFIVLKMNHTAHAIAITYALSAGTGAILGVLLAAREFKYIFSGFRRKLLGPILNMAWPIAIVSLVGIFMLNVDVVLLGYFKNAEQVGLYSASQKIVQLLYVLPGILAASLYPVFAKAVGENNHEKTRYLMEHGMAASLLLAVPIAVGGIILAKSIILFLYHIPFLAAVPNFQILLLTVLIIFPAAHLTSYILVYDKQKNVVPIILAGSVANLVFNAALIPFYGAVGAAVATVAAQLLLNGLQFRLAKKINYFRILPRLKKISAAALLMGIVSFTLSRFSLNVFMNIGISAALYFGLLYLMREPIIHELKALLLSESRGPILTPQEAE